MMQRWDICDNVRGSLPPSTRSFVICTPSTTLNVCDLVLPRRKPKNVPDLAIVFTVGVVWHYSAVRTGFSLVNVPHVKRTLSAR